jgi:hypothetical protein
MASIADQGAPRLLDERSLRDDGRIRPKLWS